MPEFSVETMDISYICPECEIRCEYPFNYMPGHDAYYTKAHWCKRCGARHSIEYWVHITRKGEAQFKILEFSSNDELYNKRFKVLNQERRKR